MSNEQRGDAELTTQLSSVSNDFQRVDNLLRKLNFFRAVGAVRSELRHSDFLAFLLSPDGAHQLGDAFLKAWLARCLRGVHTHLPFAADQVEGLDLRGVRVLREFDYIDIAVVDEVLGFGVILENKVDTGEHNHQLERYWIAFQKDFPRVKDVLGLYLSPAGEKPSNSNYLAVSYKTVAEAVDYIRERQQQDFGADLKVLLRHYSDLLRGEFMEDQKAAELAWTIHSNYPKAVAFIGENDPITQVRIEIKRFISEAGDLTYDSESGNEIRFTLPEWAQHAVAADPSAKDAGWLFWFDNFKKDIKLRLGVNKNIPESRGALLRAANSNPRLFNDVKTVGADTGGWPTVWSKMFLQMSDLKRLDRPAVFNQLNQRWKTFHEETLPQIRAALAKANGL